MKEPSYVEFLTPYGYLHFLAGGVNGEDCTSSKRTVTRERAGRCNWDGSIQPANARRTVNGEALA